MALPEGYLTEESESEDEGLSFPDDFRKVKQPITVDESKLLPGQKLINAILDRKLDKINLLLEEGTDVNYCTEYSGWTPLMYASSLGTSDHVELLLKKGANPNFHDKLTTPLMCLCDSTSFYEDGLVKCFNLLIDAGANINVCDSNKMTPLMHATCRGHMQLVARLLELGSDLEMRDNDGWTAIFFAVNSGDANMVQMLKDAGSNLSLIDGKGRTLYDLASVKSFQVIAEIVSHEKKISAEDIQHELLPHSNMTKYQLIMFDMPDYTKSDFNGFVEDTLKTIVAAGLSNLVSLFIENRIGYGQFLTFQEKDWKEIGVEMSFDRKKLTTFAYRIIQKKWSRQAFIKQINEKFTMFKLVRSVSNAVRIIHILIATYYVCKRDSCTSDPKLQIKIKESLSQAFNELHRFMMFIKRVYSLVENIDRVPLADFVPAKK